MNCLSCVKHLGFIVGWFAAGVMFFVELDILGRTGSGLVMFLACSSVMVTLSFRGLSTRHIHDKDQAEPTFEFSCLEFFWFLANICWLGAAMPMLVVWAVGGFPPVHISFPIMLSVYALTPLCPLLVRSMYRFMQRSKQPAV